MPFFPSRKVNFDDLDLSLMVSVEGTYYPYCPARITSDPYYSSPEEPAEFEFSHVWVGKVDILDALSDVELVRLEEMVCDRCAEQNNEGPDPDEKP
jgi:hypothetical protein